MGYSAIPVNQNHYLLRYMNDVGLEADLNVEVHFIENQLSAYPQPIIAAAALFAYSLSRHLFYHFNAPPPPPISPRSSISPPSISLQRMATRPHAVC